MVSLVSMPVAADATGVATSTGMLAIALEAKTDTQAMNVALSGSFVRNDAWNWNICSTLYASTTAGAITEIQPSLTNEVIRVIGWSVSSTTIWFMPSSDYLTHI